MDLLDVSLGANALPPPIFGGAQQPLIPSPQTYGVCPGLDPFDIPPQQDPGDPFGLGLQQAPGAALNEDVEARDALKNLLDEYERSICRLVAEKEISGNRLNQMIQILGEKLRGEKLKTDYLQAKITSLETQKGEYVGTVKHIEGMQKTMNEKQALCEKNLSEEKQEYEKMKDHIEESVRNHLDKKKNASDERDKAVAKLNDDILFAESSAIPFLLDKIEQKRKEIRVLSDRCSELVQLQSHR